MNSTLIGAIMMLTASSVADEYHLNKAHFLGTLQCESAFKVDAVGDDGASVGIAQIALRYHPEVTREDAMNPHWAMVWMARQWQKGNAHLWSCWRMLYG